MAFMPSIHSPVKSSVEASPSDVPAAIVSARYGLTPCMARLICFLAQIGGRVG